MNRRNYNQEKVATLKMRISVIFMMIYVLFFYIRGLITNDTTVDSTLKFVFVIVGAWTILTFSYFIYRIFTLDKRVYLNVDSRANGRLNYAGILITLFAFAGACLLLSLYALTPFMGKMTIMKHLVIFNVIYLSIVLIGQLFIKNGLRKCKHIYDFDQEKVSLSQIAIMHIIFIAVWWFVAVVINPFGSLSLETYDPESMKLAISNFLILAAPMTVFDGYIRLYLDEQKYMEEKKIKLEDRPTYEEMNEKKNKTAN